jgi:hypothetical protein
MEGTDLLINKIDKDDFLTFLDFIVKETCREEKIDESMLYNIKTDKEKFAVSKQLIHKIEFYLRDYIQKFRVIVNDGPDEFKTAYWTGRALMDIVNPSYRASIFKNTLRLLTDFLYGECGDTVNKEPEDDAIIGAMLMKIKMIATLDERNLHFFFGEYGIYFIFKFAYEYRNYCHKILTKNAHQQREKSADLNTSIVEKYTIETD